MDLLTKDIMSHPVVTIREDASVADLIDLFRAQQISGVPVVDASGVVVGVVAITDIVALGTEEHPEPNPYASDFHSSPAMDALSRVHHLLEPHDDVRSRRVHEVMCNTFMAVPADMPLPQLAGSLLDHRIHRILVIQDGHPLGIVSLTDILRALRDHAPIQA